MHRREDEGKALRRGLYVIAVVMIIDVLKLGFGVMLPHGALIPLAILALVATWLIAYYFMHIPQLWRREED